MTNNKSCKGTLYLISGKSHCVGEKKTKTRTSRKTRTNRKTRTSRKTKSTRKLKKTRSAKKNIARGPGYENDVTRCCMCEKVVHKDHSLLPSECKIKHGLRAHRICKECWFDEEDGFALEGKSHKCPGCEKGLPLTRVKVKTPEMVDLTLGTDSK